MLENQLKVSVSSLSSIGSKILGGLADPSDPPLTRPLLNKRTGIFVLLVLKNTLHVSSFFKLWGLESCLFVTDATLEC